MRRMIPNEIIRLVARHESQRVLTMMETADGLNEEEVAGEIVELSDPGWMENPLSC